jgi:hypothetical protein
MGFRLHGLRFDAYRFSEKRRLLGWLPSPDMKFKRRQPVFPFPSRPFPIIRVRQTRLP